MFKLLYDSEFRKMRNVSTTRYHYLYGYKGVTGTGQNLNPVQIRIPPAKLKNKCLIKKELIVFRLRLNYLISRIRFIP